MEHLKFYPSYEWKQVDTRTLMRQSNTLPRGCIRIQLKFTTTVVIWFVFVDVVGFVFQQLHICSGFGCEMNFICLLGHHVFPTRRVVILKFRLSSVSASIVNICPLFFFFPRLDIFDRVPGSDNFGT